MRVSLQIDGDASGAKQAAQDASAAVTTLGKSAEDASGKIKDGFDQASGAASKFNDAQQNGAAANDNIAGTVANVSSKVAELATKLLGSQSAAAKAAAGVADVASKAGEITKAASFVAGFATAIGAAITVASTLYGIINSGSASANAALEEQARLIGIVRDAYSDATKTAGEFLTQSKALTQYQTEQNLAALQKSLNASASDVLAKLAPQKTGGQANALPGELGFGSELSASIGPTTAATAATSAYDDAVDKLRASIAAGKADFASFNESMVAIANSARASNPALAALADGALAVTKPSQALADAAAKAQAQLALMNGTATDAQKKLLGLQTTASQTGNEFDRMTKAMSRQAAAQEAEAQTAGTSAGAAAKLRTEFILTEAAQQSGITVAGKYADQIKAISDRAGEAAQKLAQAKLASDTAFNFSQLGRTQTEAAVADQLRGAFGDNADLNSSAAAAVRLNETLKDVKSTTQDIASGAFKDFRTELQQGVNAFKALGDAAVNALQKIIDKLADKTFDKVLSGLINAFGGGGASFLSSGSIPGAIGPTSVNGAPLFDTGGWTGPGGKYEPAGIVHRDEFVFDKESTNRIGVANLYRQMRGYADGGLVGTPAPWGGGLGGAASGQASPQAAGVVEHRVTVSVDQNGNLQAFVKKVSTENAVGVVGEAFNHSSFVDRVAAAMNAARAYRKA